jgi:hypothetical protein
VNGSQDPTRPGVLVPSEDGISLGADTGIQFGSWLAPVPWAFLRHEQLRTWRMRLERNGARTWRDKCALLCVLVLAWGSAEEASGPPRAKTCVRVTGLRNSYRPTETIQMSIVNECSTRVLVNVAVESRGGKGWSESVPSISDVRDPFGKVTELTPIETGGSASFEYLAAPKTGTLRPGMFLHSPVTVRFRVDVKREGEAPQAERSEPVRIGDE